MASPALFWIRAVYAGSATLRWGPNTTAGRFRYVDFSYEESLNGCHKAVWTFAATPDATNSYAGKLPPKASVVTLFNGPDEDEDAIWIGRVASVRPKLVKGRALVEVEARGHHTHTGDLKYQSDREWVAGTTVATIFEDVLAVKLPKLWTGNAFILDGGRALINPSPNFRHATPKEIFNWAVGQGTTGDLPLLWGVRLAKVVDGATTTAEPALFLNALPDRATPLYSIDLADGLTVVLGGDLDEIYTHVVVWYGTEQGGGAFGFVEVSDGVAEALYDNTRRTQEIEPGRYDDAGSATRAATVFLEHHREERLAGSVLEIPYSIKVQSSAADVEPENIQVGQWIEIPDLSDVGGLPEGAYLITHKKIDVKRRRTWLTLGRQKGILDAYRQLRPETPEAMAQAGQPRVQTVLTKPESEAHHFIRSQGGTEGNPPLLDADEQVPMDNMPEQVLPLVAGWGLNTADGSAIPTGLTNEPPLLPGEYTTWRIRTDLAIVFEIRNSAGALVGTATATAGDADGSLSTPITAGADDHVTFLITGTPTATRALVEVRGERA